MRLVRIAKLLGTIALVAGTAVCSKGTKDATKISAAAPALAVAVTPTGEGQVTLTDERGQPVPTQGVTGRVELADGDTVPLTPGGDGRTLTAPLGGHMEGSGRECMATVRVTMPGGVERTKDVDLCREHARHGGAGHAGPGGPHGPGGMGGHERRE